MRKLKFRAWIKPLQKLGAVNELYFDGGAFVCGYDFALERDDIEVMQFTGLKDKNGAEIYEGDLVNIFYTSKSGEFVFDGIYSASITPTGIVFNFVKLLWESGGRNQYPYEKANFTDYGFVRSDYKNRNEDLRPCVAECSKWEYSNYFEVIGNIYENPELLESK